MKMQIIESIVFF